MKRFPNATAVIRHAKLRIKLFTPAAPQSVRWTSQSRHLDRALVWPSLTRQCPRRAKSVADHAQSQKLGGRNVRHRHISCIPVTQAAGTNPSRFPSANTLLPLTITTTSIHTHFPLSPLVHRDLHLSWRSAEQSFASPKPFFASFS